MPPRPRWKPKPKRPQPDDDGGKGRPGRKSKPVTAEPSDKAQRNFTDPGSRVMPTKKGFIQGYNAQAVTCPRTFIQRQLESRLVLRHEARVEQHAIGGAGRGCAADRMLR